MSITGSDGHRPTPNTLTYIKEMLHTGFGAIFDISQTTGVSTNVAL